MEGTEFRLFSESFEGAEIYGSIQKLEKQTGKQSWGNYCLGVLQVLQERGLAPNHGFSLILTTDLPMSAGLSSSAAVEVATAMCLLQLAVKRSPRMNSLTFANGQKMILLDYHVESLIRNFYIWENESGRAG